MWNLEQIRSHILGQLSVPLSNFGIMGSMDDKGMAVDRSWRGPFAKFASTAVRTGASRSLTDSQACRGIDEQAPLPD